MGDQYNLGFYAMVSEIVDQFTDEKRILDDFSERRFLKVKLQACFYFIPFFTVKSRFQQKPPKLQSRSFFSAFVTSF